MPPVSDGPPASSRPPRPRFALPHGWWRWRPSIGRPSLGGFRLLRQPWLLSLAAALWAAGIGLLLAAAPMLILWLGSTGSDTEIGWMQSLRWAGLLWLVANGAAVSIAGITVTLLPWGLMLVPLVLLSAGSAWAARRSEAREPLAVVWVIVPGVVLYTLIAAGIDVLVSEPVARVDLLDSVLGAAALALLGSTWGAVRASGLMERLPVPATVRAGARAAAAAAMVIVAIGAVAAAVSLIIGIDDAITMGRSLAAGAGGGVGLLALGLAYVPVMVVWGAAYVLGAGVSLGSAVVLSPFLATSAPAELPAFPLLATLPQQPPPMSWLLPVAGIVAGVIAGALVARVCRVEGRLVRLAVAAAAAVGAGLLLAVLAWLSLGSLGTGALVDLGPDPVIVGVLAAVLVSIGAIPAAVAPSPPARPTLSVAPAEEIIPVPVAEPMPVAVEPTPPAAEALIDAAAHMDEANALERELAYPAVPTASAPIDPPENPETTEVPECPQDRETTEDHRE